MAQLQAQLNADHHDMADAGGSGVIPPLEAIVEQLRNALLQQQQQVASEREQVGGSCLASNR